MASSFIVRDTVYFDEHQRAFKEIRALRQPKTKPNWILSGLVGCVLGLLVTLPITHLPYGGVLTGLSVGILLLYGAVIPWGNRVQLRRERSFFELDLPHRKRVEFHFSENGLDCKTIDGTYVGSFKWQHFQDAMEMPESWVFFCSPARYIQVPFTELSSEERQIIVSWTGQKDLCLRDWTTRKAARSREGSTELSRQKE